MCELSLKWFRYEGDGLSVQEMTEICGKQIKYLLNVLDIQDTA